MKQAFQGLESHPMLLVTRGGMSSLFGWQLALLYAEEDLRPCRPESAGRILKEQ